MWPDDKKTCDGFGGAPFPLLTWDLDECDEDRVKQTLMIDVQGYYGELLASEKRMVELMEAMSERIDRSVLTYRCDVTVGSSLRCFGLDEESHVMIQAWPLVGALSIIMFAPSSTPLITVLPLLEEELEHSTTVPRVKWARKIRGSFSEGVDKTLSEAGVGRMDASKRLVAAVTSDFQHIQIWDTTRKAQYRYDVPEQREKSVYGLEGPLDRIVYLDDVSQSRRFGDAEYHEALVHPAMFAHDNPVRVAIIGGGEGATLREVLKHSTVEKVLMIEIDELMVNVSREHLPEWSYCGDLVGSAVSCFDDPRAEVHFEDAIAWFADHFRDMNSLDPAEQFDVVIMDALDPSTVVAFSDVLYKSNDLVISLYNSLKQDGLFVIQVGEASGFLDPPLTHYRDDQLWSFLTNFEAAGFGSVQSYDDIHSGFESPWSFNVIMKNRESRRGWFRSQAEIDWRIRKRAVRTLRDESPFRYFDGSTMMEWKYPSRIGENVYCRLNPTPLSCFGVGYVPKTLEVHVQGLYPGIERLGYSAKPVPTNARLLLESIRANNHGTQATLTKDPSGSVSIHPSGSSASPCASFF
jgi:spermidine synthase